jgi:hypothetical protein
MNLICSTFVHCEAQIRISESALVIVSQKQQLACEPQSVLADYSRAKAQATK